MISNVANSKRLSKIQYEKSFLNQFRNSFIQFAIEVDDPKNLPDVLDKIKNATTGLYIKSDGLNLLSNSKDQKTVTVYQIPKDVNSLSACCDWIFDKHTPNTNSSLATIACDDRRIVINSNQSITDTEYFVNLLKNIQNTPYDKFFTHKNPIPLHFQRNIVKNEFDEFLETKYHHLKEWPAFQPSDLTFLSLHDHPLNSPDIDHLQHMCKCDIKISELSPFIYDKYIRKVRNIYEFMWTGLCMALNATNGEFGPFGIANCIDFRKLLPNGYTNYPSGHSYTCFSLCVQNVNPQMTIGEICSQFRGNFDLVKVNDQFYKDYMFPLEVNRDDCAVSHFSNVGPLNIKAPYKDFYLQSSEKEDGMPPLLNVSCYSKNVQDSGLNDVVLHMRYSPAVMSKKDADKIFSTYVYFLKNADPKRKSGDVLDELIHFQKSLN